MTNNIAIQMGRITIKCIIKGHNAHLLSGASQGVCQQDDLALSSPRRQITNDEKNFQRKPLTTHLQGVSLEGMVDGTIGRSICNAFAGSENTANHQPHHHAKGKPDRKQIV